MSVFKITVQYQTRDGYPVVVEFSQADRFVVRAERRMVLDEDALLALKVCEDAAEYGKQLGAALFQGSLLEAFVRARATSADRMHMLLCVEPAELRALNWERLQAPLDAGSWDFLALDQRLPLSIYTPSSTDRRFLPFGPGDLRTLILAASPRRLAEYGLAPFAALDAVTRIGAAMRPIPFSTLASDESAPNRLGPPTIDTLCEVLTSQRFPLLHIICHGQLRADGETVLYLDDAEGGVRPLPATQLISRLSRLRGAHGLPHFIFLAACESAHPDAEAALGGLGQRLVRELGMPAVVAMTARVSLDLATELARRFYPRLRAHGAVDVALVEANAGIAEHTDVLVPALYSRLGERALWTERDEGRQLTPTEIEHGISRLEQLIEERAPAMLPELSQAARATREVLSRKSADEREGWVEPVGLAAVLGQLEAISSEALERTFRHIALGRSLPDYDRRCPFPGLNAFRVDDSAFFFGREELVRRMAERLLAHRFLAVLGPSGSGKSSVILAGLVPELSRRYPAIPLIYLTPGREPVQRLEHALLSAPVQDTAPPPGQPFTSLCLVNQFEEVFTLCSEQEQRRSFFARLLALTRHHAVIVTMRADFWGECAEHPALKEAMLAHQELVGPMSSTELRRAIEQQVGAVGLRFEDGLCGTMLAAIEEEPGGMPLLQHTLLELWKRRRGFWLRAQEYRNLGGVQLAIAETAEVVYQQIAASADEQQRMRDIFTRLTLLDTAQVAGRKARDSRRCVPFSDLVPVGTDMELTRRMIARLADARLIVTRVDAVSGELEIEVAHEAVIRHWPRLRAWLDEDRIAIGFREGVRQAAKEWLAGGREEHLLLHRGERLRLVCELGRSTRHPLNQQEQDYIDACLAAQTAEQQQKEEQRRREKQHTRDLGRALERALTAARTAQSRQLSMHSAAVYEREPTLALLLAREAARLQPTAEALSQIQGVLTGPLELALLRGHTDAVVACCYGPDMGPDTEPLLLTASVDRTARLWNSRGQGVAILRGHQDALLDAVWSRDGQRILTLSSDKTARLWSRLGEQIAMLAGHQGSVLGGAFSPDGERIVTCSNDHTVRLWDQSGAPVLTLSGHTDAVTAARFSADGSRILTTSKDRSARVWSREGELLYLLRGHAAAVSGGCFDSSGLLILTFSWDQTARLWSSSGVPMATLGGHTDRVNDGCFSQDGKSVLTVSRDHTVRLWDASGQPQAILRGHEKGVQGGAFSPDGGRILTVSGDQTARLWAPDGRQLAVLRGHEKGVQSGSFSRDGMQVATSSWDGTVRLWPGSGSCLVALRGHQGPLTQCCVSPDGGLILTTGEDSTVRLWTLDGRPRAVLRGHSDVVSGAAFTPDGSRVLTFSRDCSACLWSRDGVKLRWLLGHADWVIGATFSRDGSWLVTASIDGSARIWSQDSAMHALLAHGDAALTGCSFSPDSQLVMTTSTSGTAILWSLDGEQRAVLDGHRESIASGTFSPDGSLILTTSWDGSACLWSTAGEELKRLSGHTSALLGGCFSRDGSMILTYSRDQTARIWSREGQPLAVLRGHRDWVLGGCFGNKSGLVLTVSRDSTARLWSQDGHYEMSLRGHSDWVTAGCFCSDDNCVITVSADHTARLWPATLEGLDEAAGRHALRELSPRERDAYLDFER